MFKRLKMLYDEGRLSKKGLGNAVKKHWLTEDEYKLISGEKQTQQRDTILRICLAAEFTLVEAQEALVLYGMAPLYQKIRRDTAFIVAFSNRIYDIHEVDAIQRENDLPPFLLPDPD